MKKRYVFDLDGTLLTGDYSLTDQYFKELYGDKAYPFLSDMTHILDRYEKLFPRYDYEDLSTFLTMKTGLDMSPRVIREWNQLVGEVKDVPEEYVQEVLEYLKSQGASLAVLTNWFGESQAKRLERAGLLEYIDSVFGGDIATKPHKEAYWIAAAGYQPRDCVFIGNNADNDYIGPRACGMDSILYDKNDDYHKSLKKIKRLDELKR